MIQPADAQRGTDKIEGYPFRTQHRFFQGEKAVCPLQADLPDTFVDIDTAMVVEKISTICRMPRN